jgi:glycosyltransferase
MQVSLITCTKNSEMVMRDCCASISTQTHKNIEHIIIDNNSIDNTLSIAEDSKIICQKIFQQKSIGIYGALNEGLKFAEGDIIGVLHSDDQLYNSKIIERIDEIFSNENIDILFANLLYVSKKDTNKIIRKWKSNLKEGIQSNFFLKNKINNGWMPPHTTIFIKKNILKEIGFYDESFKISSDYEYIIKIFKEHNFKIFFLNEFTVKMKTGGVSNKNFKNILIKVIEDYKIMKKYKFKILRTLLFKNFSKISQFF